ncbi:hypothetical protein HNV08_06530 [Winogradskyella eckloniae]|uniref:hypothetical protein n=1 Tax=Winogradskyella eckloniae TaxID=1089306 RepID=UPI0015635ABE|nr:hypothetical protein [Winogradskyella eckloniae]NRD19698.1 hypothetical protein [Winogradskyella eckloniae]
MNTTAKHLRSTKSTIRSLSIVHFALCTGIILFGAMAYFNTEKAVLNFSETEDIFFYLVPAFAIVLTIINHFLFQNNLKRVKAKTTLKDKLTHYYTIKIIQFALIDGPAIFGIAIFLITSNQYYIIISMLLLAYLILLRPTTNSIKDDLNLNASESREFREAIQ